MSLTRNEAKALLTQLADLKVGDVLDNTDLVNALICLKQIAKDSKVSDQVMVTLKMYDDNKVTAIKAFRIVTGAGLKEAKDAIDKVWPTKTFGEGYPYVLPLGPIDRNVYEAADRSIRNDSWMRARVTLEASSPRVGV